MIIVLLLEIMLRWEVWGVTHVKVVWVGGQGVGIYIYIFFGSAFVLLLIVSLIRFYCCIEIVVFVF